MKKFFFFLLLGLVTWQECLAQTDSSYTVTPELSPLDKPIRVKTVAIICHTMEGELRYGLKEMVDSALCNYAISYSGEIINIVDKYKMSNGAGRSMLYGDTSISIITINIEFEGFAANYPTKGQLSPWVAKFIHDLQIEFGIPDSMVLIHPFVACFYPDMKYNPFPGYYVRGRKSDAFWFADPKVRAKIGLGPMKQYDMDVYDGRVIQNKAQAKKMGIHVFTKQELAERKLYLARLEMWRADSMLLAEVKKVEPISPSFCIDEAEIKSDPIVMPTTIEEEPKKVFSLGPFILPKREKFISK